ncbi:MAG TPA: hypothetical protein VJB02_04130 [Coxiellaceae bacterium]|nr:hypothetical protein [Coxiellaceae bacterium]
MSRIDTGADKKAAKKPTEELSYASPTAALLPAGPRMVVIDADTGQTKIYSAPRREEDRVFRCIDACCSILAAATNPPNRR